MKYTPPGGLTAVVIVMVTAQIDEGVDLMRSRFLSAIMRISTYRNAVMAEKEGFEPSIRY